MLINSSKCSHVKLSFIRHIQVFVNLVYLLSVVNLKYCVRGMTVT